LMACTKGADMQETGYGSGAPFARRRRGEFTLLELLVVLVERPANTAKWDGPYLNAGCKHNSCVEAGGAPAIRCWGQHHAL